MEDRRNRLTPIFGGRIGPALLGTNRSRQDIRPEHSTLTTSDLEQNMGSTTFGNDGSTGVGLAMPQDKNINRAGSRRVRVIVAPS
jgi:hypothetical protein